MCVGAGLQHSVRLIRVRIPKLGLTLTLAVRVNPKPSTRADLLGRAISYYIRVNPGVGRCLSGADIITLTNKSKSVLYSQTRGWG